MRSVPRDLNNICLKCLEKEPGRRYPTARAMAEDLERFLKGEPTLARPTTRFDQAWRWCRRKPAIAGLLVTALLLLLTLAIGSPIAAFRIQHALQAAKANLYSTDLNVVQTALAEADLVHARALLDRHRPAPGQRDTRGFEWRYLWNLCQGDEEFAFEPVIRVPRRVVFSHDGRMLAAGESSGNLSVVWNLTTKTVMKSLPHGDRPVIFAPHNPELVTAGVNGLKLWDTQIWQERELGPCHEQAAAVFSPDGRSLIVYGIGLQVWDTQGWTLVSSNDFGKINIWVTSTLSVSHDSTRVSCARGFPYATAGEVEIFRLPSLDPVALSERLPRDVSSAVFHSERDLLVTGGWSGHIRFWDSHSGRELPSIMKQTSRIMAMAFSPADPNVLATTGGDRSVRLWDVASQQERMRLHGAVEEVVELAFSPDGQTIATGGYSNPITLWNVAQTKADTIAVPTQTRNCVLGYSRDGETLVTIDATGRVLRRDPSSLAVLETICRLNMESASIDPSAPDFRVTAMGTTTDIKHMALGMTNGTVEIWDLTSRTNVLFKAHSAPASRGAALSPDSLSLVTVGEDHEVHLWNLGALSKTASARLEELPDPHWPLCVSFSPGGHSVAVGSWKQLSILDGSNLSRLWSSPTRRFVSLRFSPDGRYLATGHERGHLSVWDTDDWSQRTLPGHDLAMFDIASRRTDVEW